MLCELCHEREARVFITKIMDGVMTNQQLCQICGGPIVGQMPLRPTPLTFSSPPDAALQGRPADCPEEVALPDPVTVRELAAALHVEFYQVIGILMPFDIYKSADDALDFTTASLVCAHYGVIPYRG